MRTDISCRFPFELAPVRALTCERRPFLTEMAVRSSQQDGALLVTFVRDDRRGRWHVDDRREDHFGLRASRYVNRFARTRKGRP